jgi:hypothetical protein
VSVYKNRDGRSPYWHFDFQVRGRRFHGSTKCPTRREAEKVEAAEREKAKRLTAQLAAAKTSLRLDDVAERYWQEVGQHHAGADGTEHRLALLIEFFGKDKLLTDITGDDVARFVAWRRGHRARKVSAAETFISPHTVNHTTKQLRTLFARAKLWGVRFEHEPRWSKHSLAVPPERVRELSDDEADPEAWVLHVIRFGLDALPATPRNWRAIIIGGSIVTHLKLLEAMGSIIERFGHATMVRPLGEDVQTIGDYDFH